jgi:ATP-dependent Clp protease adapter protein ClpS
MPTDSTDAPVLPLPRQATAPATAPPRVDQLPPWSVHLHNDDVNFLEEVVATIVTLKVCDRRIALLRALEAHDRGCSLLTITHRERAELLQEQFTSRRMTVTIEPA